MALELNGTTGVSLVQDGVVTAADLASTLDLSGKTVTLPSGTGGKVLQVEQGTYATETDFNHSGFTDTGLTASITPSSTSSKILIHVHAAGCGKTNGANAVSYSAYRVAKVIGGTTTEVCIAAPQQGYTGTTEGDFGVVAVSYLDSPATTSSIEYKLLFRTGGTGTHKFLAEDQSGNQPTATIILMEIAG